MSKFKKVICYCLIFNIFFTNILTSCANTARASSIIEQEDLDQQEIAKRGKISAPKAAINYHITEEYEEKYTLKGFKPGTVVLLIFSTILGLFALLAWEPINAKTLFPALGIPKLGVGTENAFYEATSASHWMFGTGAAAFMYTIYKFFLKATNNTLIDTVVDKASKIKQRCIKTKIDDELEENTLQIKLTKDQEKIKEANKHISRKMSTPQALGYGALEIINVGSAFIYSLITLSYLYKIEMPHFPHFFNFFAPFLLVSIMTDKVMTGHSRIGTFIERIEEHYDKETAHRRQHLKKMIHNAIAYVKKLDLEDLDDRNILRRLIKTILPGQALSNLDEEIPQEKKEQMSASNESSEETSSSSSKASDYPPRKKRACGTVRVEDSSYPLFVPDAADPSTSLAPILISTKKPPRSPEKTEEEDGFSSSSSINPFSEEVMSLENEESSLIRTERKASSFNEESSFAQTIKEENWVEPRSPSIAHNELYSFVRQFSTLGDDPHDSKVLRGFSYAIPFFATWGLATVLTQSLEVMSESPLFARILGGEATKNRSLAAIFGSGAGGWIAFAESRDILNALKRMFISPISQFKTKLSGDRLSLVQFASWRTAYTGVLILTAWAYGFVEYSEYRNQQNEPYGNIFTNINTHFPWVKYSALLPFALFETLSFMHLQDRAYQALWRRGKQMTIWTEKLYSHQQRLIGLLEVLLKSVDRLNKEGLSELESLIFLDKQRNAQGDSLRKEEFDHAPASSSGKAASLNVNTSKFQYLKGWLKDHFSPDYLPSQEDEENAPLLLNDDYDTESGI
ncbi:hypothetical protein IM40_00990 [Candidatus Paracaedimonas acanthamoebae]|nr:hypothetical protein IM40_00990 [Candidatus Paracaedimonas acanthamoebae]